MEIYRTKADIEGKKPSAIAVGFFDGVHVGHTALINQCVAFAKEHGLSADIFTFRTHPKNILKGEMLIPRLIPESEKLLILSGLGVDRVFDFDFTEIYHTMPPDIFAKTMLKDTFSAEAVFCGFNFHFGANAEGDPVLLKDLGARYGFSTHVLDPVYVSDHIVSSSLIRRCVNSGDVEPAARLLGRDFSLTGVVERGRGIGRVFKFPTANFFPDADITLPAYGVYVTETLADGKLYPSVTNIGVSPTIEDFTSIRVETHLLDLDLPLYGKEIKVLFKKMLREERFFDSEEALIRQITIDAETARQFFFK